MQRSITLAIGYVLLSTAAWAAPAPQPTVTTPELRLALDRVELYAETNKIDQAFALVDQLKRQYPNNSQVLEAEADLNLRLGNKGAGLAALNKAVALDPGNENILDRQREAVMGQGPFASAGYRYRNTKSLREHFGGVTAEAPVNATVSARVEAENDHFDTKRPITRTSGVSQNVSGNRQRGSFTLGTSYKGGDEVHGSLYAANQVFGAGAQYSHWDMHGSTGVEANIHKPDWTYVEMVVDGGSRDNIRLQRKQILTSKLQATLGGGFNHYNLDHATGAAEAAAWDLNLAYTCPYSFSGKHGDEVIFGAYYSVDAEYFTNIKNRVDSFGSIYRPLPTSSYEIHAVNLSVSRSFTNELYGEAFGGYAVDRMGDDGPLFGASIEYAPYEHVGIELRGSRTLLGGQHDSEKEDQIALNLKYHW